MALRNSKLPTKGYNTLPELWHTGIAIDTAFTDKWECWRALIERFNLDDELPLGEWTPIIDTCVKAGWTCPAKLAIADDHSFANIMHASALPTTSLQLRKAAVLFPTDVSSGAVSALGGASGNAESLFRA